MKRIIRIVLLIVALAVGIGAMTVAADHFLPRANACATDVDC